MLYTLMIAVGTQYLVIRSDFIVERRSFLGQGKCCWLFLDVPENQSSYSGVLAGAYGVAC